MGIVLANPSSYLREICYTVKEATGVEVSGSTVCRVLKRNGFTRKKVQHVAKQRSIEYRAQFVARAMFYDRDTFVWLDETGSDRRKSMRKFGYSLRGFPPVCHRLLARGKRISAIAAICSEGILGVELTTGTVDGDKFVDFIRGTLIPNMHAYDGTSSKSVVVMDNCAIHHIPEVYLSFLKMQEYFVFFCHPTAPILTPLRKLSVTSSTFFRIMTTSCKQQIIQSILFNQHLTTLQKNNALDGSMIVDTYEIAIATLVSHMIGYVTVMHVRCC